MILVIGLGNPGKKYKNTPHNLGFHIVEEFQKKNNFPDFKFSKKFNAEISEGVLNGGKIILAKPQTFMNSSGKPVKKILLNLKSEILNLFVIHDDIDLPLGKIKISKARGSAGHKGVESIIDELRTKNFVRFRIGTKPKTYFRAKRGIKVPRSEATSGSYNLKPKTLNRIVLQKFKKEEEKTLKEVIKKTVEAIEFSLREGLEKAMSEYNR